MFTFEISNIDAERMNIMIYRILDLEKKNLKTKSISREKIINKIERIITEESKKLR